MSKKQVCSLCGETSCSCKNEKPLKVRFCPRCKSKDVGFVFHLKNLFGLLPRVRCQKCGYSAVEFPLLVVSKKKVDELERKMKSKKKKPSRRKK